MVVELYVEHAAAWLVPRLPGANLCSTWELLCQTELQEPLQALWHAEAVERTPDTGKGGWYVHFLPVDSQQYPLAERLLENNAEAYPADRQPIETCVGL